ncbi:MAG TPA: class I SAM-dependent methyltransferase [Caulobacteraceae bacterium]|jgi:SAM-dependent methyltransferase|nr:class I SAM-dependent methyltransferase [Caulobacteraceae bacterium]
MERLVRLLGDRDPAALKGLEIGPCHAPLVAKGAGDVLYVDYATTEEIRAAWTKTMVAACDMHEVDVAWGDRRLADVVPGPVDYVVASHVIEHAPDLAGWLAEIREVLKPGGVLGLAVPDRRFTFDLLRPTSTLGEVVEAHLLGYRRPSIRQVFDSYALTRPNAAAEAWAADRTRTLKPVPAKLHTTFATVQAMMADGRYVDSHCWVFTPASFLDTLEGMLALGWFGYAVEAFFPTEAGGMEFQVRLAPETDADVALASIQAARGTLAVAAVAPEDR